MVTKIIIVLFLFTILGSLFSGLFYLVKDKGTSERTVRALTVRISLSVLLFVLLMIGYATGILQPHGVVPAG
ncbi:MAG: twin transmembrane helix small protein [Pseudomonadota bacterium]